MTISSRPSGEPGGPGDPGSKPSPIPVPSGFPVVWDDDEEPALLWTWDEFHSPLPKTPMTQSLGYVTRDGTTQAMRETGRYSAGGRRKVINGYPYSASPRTEPSESEQRVRQGLIDRAISDARRRWDQEWQPRLERDLDEMKSVDPASLDGRQLLETVDRFLRMHSQHWYLHHLIVMPAVEAADRLEKRYVAAMGPQGKAVAHRLLHGAETKTVESIRALDALAEQAADRPEIQSAVDQPGDAAALSTRLGGSVEGRAWLAVFDRFLREHGYRPAGFDYMYPTWVEDPSFVLQNLRARLRRTATGQRWEDRNSKLDAERDSLLAEVRARLAPDPAALAEFERAYRTAQRLWPLKEDHSHYIDQASTAIVRIVLAEVGRRLAKLGSIADADDVWFVTIDEARSALRAATGAGPASPGRGRRDGQSAGDLRRLVGERRADHARWSRMRPPKHLGSYPAGYDGERAVQVEKWPAELREVRGTGASPGDATGMAVVVMSPDDFAKVRPGSILVCRSTAPMWTPLFEVVAGLVSEAGGILSHPAVVAREFGLPAVVGVRDATTLITDGRMLTLSGSTGLVRFGD